MKINIHTNYHTGSGNLDNDLPWITPGSTYMLEELMCGEVPWTMKDKNSANYDWSSWQSPRKKSDLKVLEFGSGGSTVFFARRCKSVLSFEYNEAWVKRLTKHMKDKGLNNATIINCGDGEGMLNHVDKLQDGSFDVLMVDNDWKIIPRDDLLFKSISKLNKEKAIIVLDNYGSPACFPVTHLWTMEQFISELLDEKWNGEEFNSIWWGGLGTRIFHKGFFERKVIKENKRGSARWFKI